jgi:DME family drug/metabolite transporter
MTVAGVLWGTIGPAVSYLDDHTALDAVQISAWRIAIAAVALGALWAARGRRRLPAALTRHCLAIGVVTSGYQLAYFAAVADAGVAVPTFVALGLGPIFVALGETALFGRRPDRRTLAVLGAALAGLALLLADGPKEATAGGIGLALLSAIGAATAVLMAGSVARRVDTTTLNALAAWGGLAVLVPLVVVAGGPGSPGGVASTALLLHLGLVVSVLAYGLYFAAAKVLPPTHVVILTLLEPLTAAALAVILLGQTLTASAVAGGILLLGAVVALRGAAPDPVLEAGAVAGAGVVAGAPRS